MQCNREGCEHLAKWQVGFKAWAKGHSRTSTPLEGLMGLAVCDEHKGGVTAASLFSPLSTASLDRAFLAAGKAPADWQRAQITFTPLIDGKLTMPGAQ